jgi:alpha-galactosidase
MTLRFKGLDPALRYHVNGGEETYAGDVLMQAGYPVPMLMGDYQSIQFYLQAEE